VDVLTLTATPIPRTLHFSLLGIRDMTLIQTPPRDRQPIITHVLPWSDADHRGRHPARAGPGRPGLLRPQPHRDDPHLAQRVRGWCRRRVEVAHGQMREKELEEVMRRFVAGETGHPGGDLRSSRTGWTCPTPTR
jgi:transcription-repair coupling factor (superfamily II helicase)